MKSSPDGPQAATRHAKDRRPAYKFHSARSLAQLEQRLSALEGKKTDSTSFKCVAATDLEIDLNRFGETYNAFEERLDEAEKEINDSTSSQLSERLTILEQRLKPYEEYQKQAQQAVHQLSTVKERLSSVKATDTSVKLVNEHEATIREHHSRLLQLEDQAELAKASGMSTRDLARALMQRLKRGDILDQGTTNDLGLWLGDATNTMSPANTGATSAAATTTSTVQMLGTPNTDDFTEPRPANVEESIEAEAEESSRKRQRTTIAAKPQQKLASQKLVPQHKRVTSASHRCSSGTPDPVNALAAFREGGLHSASAESARFQDYDVQIPPERKSSRKSQAPKRNADMVTWKEANVRLKGVK